LLTLRVDGALDQALAPAALARIAPEALAAFLGERRWFGLKAARLARARFAAVVPLAPQVPAVVTQVEVEAEGGAARFQLPLSVVPEPAAGAPPPVAVLARVVAGDEAGLLIDALEDPRFLAGLGAALVAGGDFGAGAPRLRATPVAGPVALPPGARLLGIEQSNSSVVFGEAAILKLYRRLERGEQPEVEIGRFLTTRTRFRHAPALLATLTFEDGGAPVVAGMLHRFVPGAVDLWADTLAANRAFFTSGGALTPRADALAEASLLGRVTRDLHRALASDAHDPAFAPSPADRPDVARWGAAVAAMIDRALDLAAAQVAAGALPPPVAALASAAVARRPALQGRVQGLIAEVGDDGGMQIRHHGDYHLGQVLRAPDGDLLVIDFEGEPARTLEERRARHSPLRDVTGMLRSYAYAAATLAGIEREARAGDAAPGGLALTTRAAHWEQGMRAAFLGGYFDAASAPLLPFTETARNALLTLFELEKTCYEIAYELHSRPDWAWIPLSAVIWGHAAPS
jgi:maltose alpha-D-glucosyltransferase/alpha-amylase